MAENDVTMGGMESLEMLGTKIKSSPGANSGEQATTSIPLPQVISDIKPGPRDLSQKSPWKHEEGMRQAASLAADGMKQGLATQVQTPHTPSGTRLTVLIKSSPGHLPHSPSSAASRMKNAAAGTTAAPGREQQRVKNESQYTLGTSTAFSSSAADDAIAQQQPPKTERRGRPKGSTKAAAMLKAELRGEPSPAPRGRPRKQQPAATAAQAEGGGAEQPKRRGRPPKAPDVSFREEYLQSQPTYVPFLCEWVVHAKTLESGEQEIRHCPAQLQNMDTLRRHVYLVHGEEEPEPEEGDNNNNNGFVCRWGKCGKIDPDQPVEVTFRDQDAFDAHLEKEHFQPFMWHVGDGVRNQGLETLTKKKNDDPDKLPDYLFRDGVQVTPSVCDQRIEDEQRRRERKRKLEALQRRNEENQVSDEEYMLQTLGLAQVQLQQKKASRFRSSH